MQILLFLRAGEDKRPRAAVRGIPASRLRPVMPMKIEIEVFEHSDRHWNRLTQKWRARSKRPRARCLSITRNRGSGLQDALAAGTTTVNIEGWFCSYKPLIQQTFRITGQIRRPKDKLIEEEYLQFLFHFYCHQLQMLQGTYRDALTGLYNRRAFNEKVLATARPFQQTQASRDQSSRPRVFVMLDIDRFQID